MWKPDETGVLRSHPFIIGYRKGFYRDIWGGDPGYYRNLVFIPADSTHPPLIGVLAGT